MCDINNLLVRDDSAALSLNSQEVAHDHWSKTQEIFGSRSPKTLSEAQTLPPHNVAPPSADGRAPFASGGFVATDSPLPSTLLEPRESVSSTYSTAAQSQGSSLSHDSSWSSHETKRSLSTSLDPTWEPATGDVSSNLTRQVSERSRSSNTAADATFLLKVMSLGGVELVCLEDLDSCGPVEPALLKRTIQSLLELQMSDEVVSLGAALIPRACVLRKERRIFAHDSEWYVEEETPLATVAAALRVAQLYLETGAHDTETFYGAWGFYPVTELAKFARILGDPETKTPVASVDWNWWCALKREFERSPEFIASTLDDTPMEG